jgi:hypothetical protein
VRTPRCQVAIEHEQAFTDRRYWIQWVDVAHRLFPRAF